MLKRTAKSGHHLGKHVPNNEVIARHGSWVKTTIDAWSKAFRKESLNCRYVDFPGFRVTTINEPGRPGPVGIYSKDHLEVFFDEKV